VIKGTEAEDFEDEGKVSRKVVEEHVDVSAK
jgi:hypothetical protein